MLEVDEFESVFRAAAKKTFNYTAPELKRLLLITDLESSAHEAYVAAVEEFLFPLGKELEWDVRDASAYQSVEDALQLVEESAPDFVCTYRNLKSDGWRWAYSLGGHLNALMRGMKTPVLVTPSPHAFSIDTWKGNRADNVMVATDHLTGDDLLVNWALKMTREKGQLHLLHVEPDEILARYLDAISKIPDLNTDIAREKILKQLLREPREYIESCKAKLQELEVPIDVDGLVVSGHLVSDYRELIAQHAIDLLVFPSLEEDRIALHGVAYSLAVELTQTPILMV